MQAAGQLRKGTNVEYFGHAVKGPNGAEGAIQAPHINHQKKFLNRLVDKVLTSFEVKANDTILNFYSYKDEDKKIEEANIKKFYSQYLLDNDFRD